MAYYSLPLERHNVDVPQEYCYLSIRKYTEDDFKPKNGKKLSKEELKHKKESIESQQRTIKQLDAGYCSLYGNEINLDTIYSSSSISYLDNENTIIYKIKPLVSRKESSYSRDYYYVKEFEVLNKFTNKKEIIDMIYQDGLLNRFMGKVFYSLCYSNEGYDLKLYEWFEYIKENYDGFKISLQDVVFQYDDYYCRYQISNNFKKDYTYELARKNIRYLLKNNLIEYFKPYDFYKEELIIALIDTNMPDVALECIKRLNSDEVEVLKGYKELERVLKGHSDNQYVKETIKLLDCKLSGITLTVKAHYDYEDRIKETKVFENINEAKTYIIKNYDVEFEKVLNSDLSCLEIYDDNGYLEFSIK